MKKIILVLICLASTNTYASDCRLKLTTDGGPFSAMNTLSLDSFSKQKQALIQLLEEKGFQLSSDNDAPYRLTALSGAGYACGNGLRFKDKLLIPVQSKVILAFNKNIIVDEFVVKKGFPLGSELRAIHRTKQLVMDLVPDCH